MSTLLAPDLFAGRSVFVSGGGSGVNLAIADVLASLGASVAICGRSAEKLDRATEQLARHGGTVLGVPADVRDLAAVESALEQAQTEFGTPVSGVVCGAAGNFVAAAEEITTNGFKAVVDIDLLGTFHVARAAFDQLAATTGSLLFVSGGPSTMAFTGQAHVSAAKAGVDQLMRALAMEWAPRGVRVNSIVPGPVAGTEGMRRLTESRAATAWVESVPLGRFAEPDEIGRLAAVLLSPLADFVTGAQVFIDGGLALSGAGLVNSASR